MTEQHTPTPHNHNTNHSTPGAHQHQGQTGHNQGGQARGPFRPHRQFPRPGNRPHGGMGAQAPRPFTPPGAPFPPPAQGAPQTHGDGGAKRHNNRSRGKKLPPRQVYHAKQYNVGDTLALPSAGDNIRIIPLGGVEEIGRNMTVIEYKDQIVVVDIGFQFKEESTPGIDYILPNTRYLEERKDKVKAIFITHGHLDHIGGIPYIADKIGNPPIYTRYLTSLLIKKRQEEFPSVTPLTINVVEKDDTIKLSDTLSVSFFAVTHAIPDAMGIIIRTPIGSIVHTGDLKVNHVNNIPTQEEEDRYAVFKDEKVLLLMTDSTSVERSGFSTSEDYVIENIDRIIRDTPGRLFIGSFASQLDRAMAIIKSGEKHGRKICIEGRSMKANLDVAKEAGYLKYGEKTVISLEEIEKFPADKVLMLVTGAQGEEFAALMRMANKTHRFIKLRKGDTVLLSSSIVPGNERSVQRLKDNLSRQGAKIIHYQVSDVHSSGHGNREDSAWLQKMIKPRFFIPVHGYHYMLTVHAAIAQSLGTPEKNIIIPDNGMIVEISADGSTISALKEKVPATPVLVDGFSVGDIQEVVLRDRQMLAQDGIFVVVASLDQKTGKLRKSPEIISRGFVYLRESQDLLREARAITKKTIEDIAGQHKGINYDYVEEKVRDVMTKFLLQKTAKRPIIISVILSL